MYRCHACARSTAGSGARRPGTSASRLSYRAAICRRRVLPVAKLPRWARPIGGLDVGHVRLAGRRRRRRSATGTRQVPLPRVAAHAVQPRLRRPIGELRVVGRDHPALADRQVLRGVEAEAGRRRDRPDADVHRRRSPSRERRPRRPAPAGSPAASARAATGAGWPAKCRTTIASSRRPAGPPRPRWPDSATAVTGSMSISTGTVPACTIAWTAPQNVIVGCQDLDPGGSPSAAARARSPPCTRKHRPRTVRRRIPRNPFERGDLGPGRHPS